RLAQLVILCRAGAERCQHLDQHRAAEPACCRASQLPALRAVALQGEADIRLGPAQCVHRRTERHVLPCDRGPARPLAREPRAYPVAFRLVAHLKIRRIRATVRSTMRTARVRGVPSFTYRPYSMPLKIASGAHGSFVAAITPAPSAIV